MKKRKWEKRIVFCLLIIFIVGFIIATTNIIKWKIDSYKTKDQINSIINSTVITEIEDDDNTEIINPPEENNSNPYWEYIKVNLINVDFSDLLKINDEVKGWIQVNGTNINYPFVQSEDNSYYLTHSFDKSYNRAGWVFLDYRNNMNNLNKNTILYAHGRVDTTMFGSLKNIIKSDWYSNSNNYIIKLSTEKENTLWQIFSVYHIKTTNDYIQTSFDNDDIYLQFLKLLQNRSIYNFNVELNSNDKILTLSTCYNSVEKVVLHAKLIKRTSK